MRPPLKIIVCIILCTVAHLTLGGSTAIVQNITAGSAVTAPKADTQVLKLFTPPAPKRGIEFEDFIPWLLTFLGLAFGVWQYCQRKRDAGAKKTAELEAGDVHEDEKVQARFRSAEEQYRETLRAELGTIKMLGLPELESVPVTLLNVFVDLRISDSFRSNHRFAEREITQPCDEARDLKPGALMMRAFERFRMLLIIGDPGSGKTTLLKYYTMCCLDPSSCCNLGLPAHTLPIYFPLRDLLPLSGEPEPLAENLARWAKSRHLEIEAKTFNEWLHRPNTLILLDGIDEVSDIAQRRRVCEWIDHTYSGLTKARFVVTSRWTGYRKLDGVELSSEHLRADVKDFSTDQQEEFLQKWFREAFCRELAPEGCGPAEWRKLQEKKAAQRAGVVIEFLKRKDNGRIRDLAAVPMLLQIMAIIWKEREYLFQSRNQLYGIALDYLLEYRDRRRKLEPLLPAERARQVIAPVALWMQEELHRDEALKEKLHAKIKEGLDTLDKPPIVEEFCENLRDRAGIIADCGKEAYIFRHKSLREYMAALQINNDCRRQPDRIDRLAEHFGDDWWEESIRFFMNSADQHVFNDFIAALFRGGISRNLDQRAQTLLETIVREAPQKKIDALKSVLKSPETNDNQKRYALDCLKIIGTTEALKEARDAAEIGGISATVRSYAADIAITGAARSVETAQTIMPITSGQPFRNPFEGNAEYLPIPGGSFRFSVTGETLTVPLMHFAKYLVTNKQYGRFIDHLAGKIDPIENILPRQKFMEAFFNAAAQDRNFKEKAATIGDAIKICESALSDDRRFDNPEQPVVGVSWYGASMYCLWLSALDFAAQGQEINYSNLRTRYRLPTEPEWEWAAAGRGPGNTLRKYPWPDDLGEPTPELANYGMNVGSTTPVGRYPKGVTPEGIMDMAGNVWEWCSTAEGETRVLRGGCWFNYQALMRCAYRLRLVPGSRNFNIGFRCVR